MLPCIPAQLHCHFNVVAGAVLLRSMFERFSVYMCVSIQRVYRVRAQNGTTFPCPPAGRYGARAMRL